MRDGREGGLSKRLYLITFGKILVGKVEMMWLKTQFDGNFWSISSNRGPFFSWCSCTVQHSQLTVVTVVSRFKVHLLVPGTRWVPQHLEIKALEGMQLWCITVNFGLKKEAKC